MINSKHCYGLKGPEMDNVCRLCLQAKQNMLPIFYKGKYSINLLLQIRDSCSIELLESDTLPKQICKGCKLKLTTVQKFREQCKQSDHILREYYKLPITSSTQASSSKSFVNIGVQAEIISSAEAVLVKNQEIVKNIDPLVVEPLQTNIDHDNEDITVCTVSYSESSDDMYTFGDNDSGSDEILYKLRNDKKTLSMTNERKSKQRFFCHICHKEYISKKALLKHTEAHLNETHLSKNIFTCNICGKTYNNKKKLDDHNIKHNNENNENFKCEICSKPFKEKTKLMCHLRVHGKGPSLNTEKQYLCDICNKRFVSKSGLCLHIKSHTGVKPFKCQYCHKGFTISSYMIRHERTHTRDKCYVCHICSAAFTSANGLRYHIRIHTGEANYHCETCGKAFRRCKYLKEHTFTHTGERPFACKICGSAYGNSGSLFVHEKKCKAHYGTASMLNTVIRYNDSNVQSHCVM